MRNTLKNFCFSVLLLAAMLPLRAQNGLSAADTAAQFFTDSAAVDSMRQADVYAVRFTYRAYGDSVVLRWAPLNAGLWTYANHYGWSIKRYCLTDTVELDSTAPLYVPLNGGKPLIPLTLEQLQQRFTPENRYAGAAAQALYGALNYNVDNAEAESAGTGTDLMSVAVKQYQEQTQRQFMAYLAAECDPAVAEALALRYVDKDVKPGAIYEYLLECLAPKDMAPVPNMSEMVVNRKWSRKEEEDMGEISFRQIDPYRAVVMWPKNKLSGYFMESREKGGTWQSRNSEGVPIWAMEPNNATRKVYGDSIYRWMVDYVVRFDTLAPGKSYEYRVQAFDAFGERTEWRQSVAFKMEDLLPPSNPVMHIILPENNSICNVEWDMPAEEPDLRGFVVTFSSSMEGPWDNVTPLLPPSARSFRDTAAQQRGRGYYRVFATDTAGNVSFSPAIHNMIEDVIAPAAPTGLAAITADSTGVVYMKWNPNKEKDLLAYKVYFANQKDHEFIECHGYVYETEYIDTVDITSLTNEIFYYVLAVDRNHNYSATSDTIRVKLPDFIKPGIALLEGIEQTGDSVTVRWKSSVSTDVKEYFIYRKFRNAANWDLLAVITPQAVNADGLIWFVDRPEPSRHVYTYSIEAIDSSRNSSGRSGFANIMVTPPSEVSVGLKVKGKYDKEAKAPKLTWTHAFEGKKDFYGVVYRSVNGQGFRDVGTFKRTDAEWVDKLAPAKSTCRYYIQLQLGQGQHSEMSNTVEVKTK